MVVGFNLGMLTTGIGGGKCPEIVVIIPVIHTQQETGNFDFAAHVGAENPVFADVIGTVTIRPESADFVGSIVLQVKPHVESGNVGVPFLRRAYFGIAIDRISPQVGNRTSLIMVFVKDVISSQQEFVGSNRIADTGHNAAVLFGRRTVQ